MPSDCCDVLHFYNVIVGGHRCARASVPVLYVAIGMRGRSQPAPRSTSPTMSLIMALSSKLRGV